MKRVLKSKEFAKFIRENFTSLSLAANQLDISKAMLSFLICEKRDIGTQTLSKLIKYCELHKIKYSDFLSLNLH